MTTAELNEMALEERLSALRQQFETVLEEEQQASARKLARLPEEHRNSVLRAMRSMVERHVAQLAENIRAEGALENQADAAALALSLWSGGASQRRATA